MPPPPAVQVTTAPPPLVYGSLIMGDNRYALMAPDESAVPQQILEGQSLNGYKLVRVQAQSVTLESSSGQQEIMFYNAMSKLRRNSSKTVATSTGASGGAVRTGSASSPSAAGCFNRDEHLVNSSTANCGSRDHGGASGQESRTNAIRSYVDG